MFEMRFPKSLVIGIVAICILPFLLTLLGVDFGSHSQPVDYIWASQATAQEALDAQFHRLYGAFTHALLEWTAFCIAVFVVFLAFSHYKITHDLTTPIIGVALFMSGCMDAFHTLAASRLIDAVAENQDLIPFTWAISRSFNALIMISGVLIILSRDRFSRHQNPGIGFVIAISMVFGVIAYLIIDAAATSSQLPQTIFPDAFLTRPYDALPLVLFIIAGLVVYPAFYKCYPSLFAHALVISAIPEIVTQLHMTFGSTALFDSHFNIAHFMKIISYFIPLLGLTLDYVRAHQSLENEILIREDVERALRESEIRQRMTFDSMLDSMITINSYGTIESINPATESIFGYSSEEIIGKNVSMLMPEPDRRQHDSYLKNYHKTDAAKIIGIGREVIACRKDGSIFSADLSITSMEIDGKKLYSGVIRDISERKKMDQMKNEFISTVSHELRTPLTSIKGSLGLISGGVAGNISPDTRHLVNIAEKNTERLLLLINDLLDMEKIESGKMDFNFDKLSVKSLIVRAIEVNSGYAKEHNITFLDISSDDDDDDDDVFVFADDDRLMQVMSNLMSNAAKFSPDGDVVEINTYRKGKIICISVTDRGPGIPEGFHSRIFKKFSQSDSSDTRKVGGTGLGLSICKVIIEKHNGHIGFNSVEGKGASFYIELSEEKLDSNNSYQQQLRQADA